MIIINYVFITILFKKSKTSFIKKMLKLFLKLSFFMNMITAKQKFIKFIYNFTMYYIKIENNNILYKSLYNLFIKKFIIL